MTDSSYYFAWLIYIIACTGVCFTGWQLIKSKIRLSWQSIIIPLLIILLTPYFSDPNQSRLAPAILTILFEGVFGDKAIALKAIFAIATLLVPGGIIIYVLRAKRNMAR